MLTLSRAKWFRHSVSRLLGAEDLSQLDNPAELLLLQPQDADAQLANVAHILSFKDAERCSSIDVESRPDLDAKIFGQADATKILTRGVGHGNRL